MKRGISTNQIFAIVLLFTCPLVRAGEWNCIPDPDSQFFIKLNLLDQPPPPPKSQLDPWDFLGMAITPVQEWAKTQRDKQNIIMEERHPYAMKICETSKASRSKSADSSDGALEPFQGTGNGHLFVFLKGACIDRGADSEQLALCKNLPVCNSKNHPKNCIAGYDPGYANDGTEVGVEEYHKNRSHLLVPGWQLAMDGIPDSQLTTSYDLVTGNNLSSIDKMIQRQLKLGLVKGVKGVHQVNGKDVEMSERELAKAGISTIVAIRRYRNVNCLNLYLDTEEEMKAAIQALNDDNRPYSTGQKTFEYNGVARNCVRDVRKAASAVDLEIRPEESTLSNRLGIAMAKEIKQSADNGNGFAGWLVHKLAPDADKVRSGDLTNDIAAPAMDMKHYTSVAARAIPDPKQAFWDANYRNSIGQFGRFPPQLAYEQYYRQTQEKEFGADKTLLKPPDNLSNAVFTDHEKVKQTDIRWTPYEAVGAKLAQYQAALESLRVNPKDPNSALKTADEIIASDSKLKQDPSTAQGFRQFYGKYVQALKDGMTSLQGDRVAMDNVTTKFEPWKTQPCGPRLTDRKATKPGDIFGPPGQFQPPSPFGFSAR